MKTLKINTTFNVPDGSICNYLDPHFNVSKQKCKFCLTSGGKKRCALFNERGLLSNGTEVYKCEPCMKMAQPIPETVQEAPKINLKQLVNDLMNDFVKARNQLNNQGLPDNLAVPQAVKFIKSKYK